MHLFIHSFTRSDLCLFQCIEVVHQSKAIEAAVAVAKPLPPIIQWELCLPKPTASGGHCRCSSIRNPECSNSQKQQCSSNFSVSD